MVEERAMESRPPRTAATGGGASERGRRAIVALVTVMYLLVITEGAIRKWLLPQWSDYLFFVRDPLVLATYVLALVQGRFPTRNALLWWGLALALVGALLVFLQAVIGSGFERQLLLAAYGWRNYFLYLPLAFVIGSTLRPQDVERLTTMTLLLSLPVAVLVALQFYAPIDAPINIGSALDEAHQFRGLGLTEEHTRPMGTFTSNAGQSLFVASAMAIVLAMWIAGARSRSGYRHLLLLAASAATLTGLAFSGSRTAVITCGLLLFAAGGLALVIRRAAVAARAISIPSLVAIATIFLYPLVFPAGYSAMVTRWSLASQDEAGIRFGVFGRALYGFVDFARLLADTPLLGFGMGLGGNASTQLGATVAGDVPLAVAETDWARHIVDLGPLLGLVFIAYRIAAVAWIARRTLQHARRSSDPMPFMLFAFISTTLLYGQIAGHGTTNGYCWIFTGLCIAASTPVTVKPRPAVAGAVAAPRFPNLLRG